MSSASGASGAIGCYRILREVGRGGAGAVFQALDPSGRAVAVKLLLAGAGASESQKRRFAAEVQALMRVKHPHLVGLLDAGTFQGNPYLVMEWVEGETLTARLERRGPLHPSEAAELVRGLAEGLAHCHALGLLHRDLKPSNVLLRADSGQALLTDFGLAKDLGAQGQQVLTATGQALGTPGYWPPEQAKGAHAALGPRSDVYGLGAVLYAALTARPPQEGNTVYDLLAASERLPTAIRRLRPEVPAALDALCLRCLEPDPARRWPSAEALGQALEAWLASPDATGAGPRRGRAPALAAGVVLLLGLGGAGLVIWRRRPAGAAGGEAPIATAADPLAAANEAERALAALAAGDAAGGRDAAERALALDPACAPALAARGEARRRQGDRAGAEQDLRAAQARDPDCALALVLQAALVQGDPRRAETHLSRALQLDPALPAAWVARARLRVILHDREGALGDARRATELAPELAAAWAVLAEACCERLDGPGATRAAARALEQGPRLPEAWQARARSRALGGDAAGAREDARRALELGPDLVGPRLLLAELALELDDVEEAEREASRALELDPSRADGWTLRSFARSSRGQAPAAESDAEDALRLDASSARAWAARALARYCARDLTQARADADRALELDPEQPQALITRAETRRLQGELDAALADADRVVALGASPQRFLVRARVYAARRQPVRARQDVARARELLGGSNPARLEAAAAEVERLLRVEAVTDPHELEKLAREALQRRDGSAAVDAAQRALRQDPQLLWPLLIRARLRLGAPGVTPFPAEIARAQADIAEVLRRDDQQVEAWALLTQANMDQGKYPAAVESARRALALQPDCLQALLYGSLAHTRLHQPEAALPLAERAVKLAPDECASWAARAEARSGLGDHAGALVDADRALELQPEYLPALLLRGELRRRSGDLPGSRQDLDRLLELSPNYPSALQARAMVRSRMGDNRGACEDMTTHLRVAPSHAPGWAIRSYFAALGGDVQQALSDAERALTLEPDGVEGLWARARARAFVGQLDGARADADRVVQLEPANFFAHYTRCEVLMARGEHEEALRAAERVCELDHGHTGPEVKARVLLGLGRAAEAREEASRAYQIEPWCAVPLQVRAEARLALGDVDGAAADVEDSLRRDPQAWAALGVRARIELARGHREAARTGLDRALEHAPPGLPEVKALEALRRDLAK